ncbi:MAG: hypothetical protein J7L15_08630 [Clostridiales bacterium]|nr:hypothetical protein [Clostridiales bacterium]
MCAGIELGLSRSTLWRKLKEIEKIDLPL